MFFYVFRRKPDKIEVMVMEAGVGDTGKKKEKKKKKKKKNEESKYVVPDDADDF